MDRPQDSTRRLQGLARGDEGVTTEVVEQVQGELRRLAARYMTGQRPGHTLQPTALVNEVWIRMFGDAPREFEGRRAFYGFASRVMRSVLVDHARAVQADKRGGGRDRVSISVAADQPTETEAADLDVLQLNEALERLQEFDENLATLVELRFFGGLAHPEIAEQMGVSLRTVERQWRLARAWLYAELAKGAG